VVLALDSIKHYLGMSLLAANYAPHFTINHKDFASGQAHASDLVAVNGKFPCT